MIRATILEGNINDNLWLEIILIITQAKKISFTYILEGNNLYQVVFSIFSDINYL